MAKRQSNGNGKSRGNGNGDGNGKSHSNGNGRRRSLVKGEKRVDPSNSRRQTPVGAKGTLIIIGGHEDKENEKLILKALAQRVGSGKLVVATVASQVPDQVWADYESLFKDLGVRKVVQLDVNSRSEAKSDEKVKILDDAAAVFFTGGDQLKLTSQLGDSPIYERVKQIYEEGGTIAGTSAGASVVCETMMVSGKGAESPKVRGATQMAPGFGLIAGVIIDQHFSERARIGRLLGAVAQNPRIVGIGIDENTAVVIEGRKFTVIGEGAVYVADASDVTFSNLNEEESDRTMSIFGVRLFMLSQGDEFDLENREATARPAEEIEEEILQEA